MILLAAVASASEPLVHDGDATVAVERVAAATERPASDFEPRAAADVPGLPPVLMPASGRIVPCDAAAVSRERLLLAIQGAEGALGYGEDDRAREELGRVAAAERCPPEPFERELLVRWLVARARAGEADAWRYARALDPSLAFADEWLPELEPAFAAAAPVPAVVLRVPQVGITVDGVAAGTDTLVVPGWHVLGAPGLRGALVVDGPATLLVPSALGPDWLAPVDDPEARAIPTEALSAVYGEGTRVFVATADGAWAATAGRTDWLELDRYYRAHPLVPAGAVVTGAGVVAGAVTGLLAALAYGEVTDAARSVERAPSEKEWRGARRDYGRDVDDYVALRFLPAIGGGVAGLGVGLVLGGVALGPVPAGGR